MSVHGMPGPRPTRAEAFTLAAAGVEATPDAVRSLRLAPDVPDPGGPGWDAWLDARADRATLDLVRVARDLRRHRDHLDRLDLHGLALVLRGLDDLARAHNGRCEDLQLGLVER